MARLCNIEDCGKPHYAHGWCRNHYGRWKNHGDPLLGYASPGLQGSCCSVEGCEATPYAFLLCRKHYDRWRQAGDPIAPPPKVFEPFSDEFWDHVDKSGGPGACWPWMDGTTGNGYGVFSRKVQGRRKHYIAHRVAYQIATGTDPGDLYVLHRCDNRPCCNPEDLFLGTHADNMADMRSKGRGRGGNGSGERNHAAKLTELQVAVIRSCRFRHSRYELAREFGVHPSTISKILTGERWSNR